MDLPTGEPNARWACGGHGALTRVGWECTWQFLLISWVSRCSRQIFIWSGCWTPVLSPFPRFPESFSNPMSRLSSLIITSQTGSNWRGVGKVLNAVIEGLQHYLGLLNTLIFENFGEQLFLWIQIKIHNRYRTRAIISRGLYSFLPNFHFSCGLYYRQFMY